MKIFSVVIYMLLLISCTKSIDEKNKLTGNYLGETPPSDSAMVFADGFVSTQFNERDMAISPENDEIFYSLKGLSNYSLIHLKKNNNVWTKKSVAAFSGKYSDLEPCFSTDGSKLFFVSNRPLKSGDEVKDYDIWYVERTDDGWGKPVNPGAPLNTEANEFYPSVTKDGTIYFCAKTNNTIGGEDLFYSKYINGKYESPVNLGDSVNTARDEFNAFVSSNEDFLIYTSTGFGAGFGGGDLWISFKDASNNWKRPINMGEKVNSKFLEFCPNISGDGKYLFYTSNRKKVEENKNKVNHNDIIESLQSTLNGTQNIFWIDANIINELQN